MNKIIFSYLLALIVLFGLSSSAYAMECATAGICSVTKSDLELKDIGEFKYAPHSYSEFEKDELMNFQILDEKNRLKIKDSPYYMTGYYSPDKHVEYYTAIMQFSSKTDALKLAEAYLGEYKEKNYKGVSGTIYQIEGPNGISVFWIYKNLVVQVFSTKGASQSEKFIKQAIDIYSKKIPPEKINLKDLSIIEKELINNDFSKIEITSPKIGGPALITGKKINIKWTSDKEEFPQVDLWITDSQNPDNYQYIATNLKNKGKFSWKIPDSLKAGQYQLSIGIPGETFIRYGTSIQITKSLKQTKKELSDGVKNGTLTNYSDCHNFANQFPDIKDWEDVYDTCDQLISKKVITETKSSNTATYNVCGNNYQIEAIPKFNGVDRLNVIESLMKTNSAPIGVCSDFDKVLKGKKISTDVRDTNHAVLGNYSVLTFIDLMDKPKKLKGHEHLSVSFSFDWNSNSVYYFPSTLKNGDATYLGRYK